MTWLSLWGHVWGSCRQLWPGSDNASAQKKKKESARDGEGIDGGGKGEETRGSTSSLLGGARLEGVPS